MAAPASGEDFEAQGGSGLRRLRWIGVSLIAALTAGLYLSGAWRQLSIGALAAHRAGLSALVADHPVAALLAFFATYAAVVAASVPGAAILTLAGGLLFGVWLGAAASLMGATLGATAVCLLARSVLSAPLARRADRQGGRLQQLSEGFRRDAFFYLLSLRLVPAVPFWFVNVAAGLARAPVRPFVAATLIGSAPATLIYSGIGAGLDGILRSHSSVTLGSLIRPGLLAPLVGLAVLSLALAPMRRALAARRAGRDA